MKKILFASLVVVAAAACGEDDAAKGTVNTASARTSVEQVGKVNSSMAMGNGANAAAAIQSMTSASQSIVAPAGQAQRELIGLLPEKFPRPDLSKAVTGTAECSATSCTFTNYGDNTTGSTWLINGTVSKTGDTSKFDIHYDVTTAGTSLKWTIDGDITVTATSVDGTINSSGDSSFEGGSGAPGVSVKWDTSVDYQAITLDAQGCATGGKVHAVVAYTASSGGNGGSFNVQGGASFGPACGQVTAD